MYAIGWRGYLLLAVALVLAIFLAAVLLWLAVGLAVVAAVAAFNYVYLPVIAARLRLPVLALAGLLLPLLLLLGWAVAGQTGLLWAGALWVGGVAAPRLAAYFLARRLQVVVHNATIRAGGPYGASAEPDGAVVGVACPTCGLVSFGAPGVGSQSCPRGHTALPAPAE
jgi:hypothetical protein